MPTNPQVAFTLKSAVGQQTFAYDYNPNDLYVTPNAKCEQGTNTLFVQYTCVMEASEQSTKYY